MEHNIFYKLLDEALSRQELISIYTDKENTEEFAAGFLISINKEFVLLKSISPNGKEDGIEVINFNEIYELSFDDFYLKQLKYLFKHSNELIYKKEINFCEKETNFYEILYKFKENKSLIAFVLYNKIVHIGVVNDIDNEYVLLQEINEKGKEDGFSCFKIYDIIKIYSDDEKLRKIDLLRKFE